MSIYIDRVMGPGHVRLWFRAMLDGAAYDPPYFERLGTHVVGLGNWFTSEDRERWTPQPSTGQFSCFPSSNPWWEDAALDFFGGESRWDAVLHEHVFAFDGAECPWAALLDLGLAPGQPFCLELHGQWHRCGAYDDGPEYELSVGWDVVERTRWLQGLTVAAYRGAFGDAGVELPLLARRP